MSCIIGQGGRACGTSPARPAGSHTTVSRGLLPRLCPSGAVVELLVEAMDGDTRASTRSGSLPAPPARQAAAAPHRPSPAARRARHRTPPPGAGSGLLLVTGEAGIGKTKLVSMAGARPTDIFVATGSCLPLSSGAAHASRGRVARAPSSRRGPVAGRRKRSRRVCPPYVLDSFDASSQRSLSGTCKPALPSRDDGWTGHRLFAVEATVQRPGNPNHQLNPAHRGPALGRHRHPRPD